MRRALASFALVLVASPASAVADENERRLTVRAIAAEVTVDAFSTSDSGAAYGGAAALDLGLRNWLEVGGDVLYLIRSNLVLHDARVDGVGGEGFELFANLHTVEMSGHARLVLDTGPFHRVWPVVGVRAGLGLRILSAPELFEASGDRVPTGADSDTTVFPFVGAEAGVTWRVSDGFQVAIVGTSTFASGHQLLGAQLALSWFSYDWF